MTPAPPRQIARLTAAVCVASVVALQTPALATAAPSTAPIPMGDALDSKLCQTLPPTPTANIPTMWHLERLSLSEAWKLADGSGVTIAVIDTGTSNLNSAMIRPEHVTTLNYVPLEDKERALPRGAGDTELGINCRHGTAVTSVIIGARGIDPRTSYSGVAPGAKVLAMRTLQSAPDENGQTKKEDPTYVINAINDAVKRKVNVINISQAMSYGSPAYAAAIKNAIDHGIVVVAAAGNADQGLTGPAYPASYPGVIAVGMTNPQDIAPTDAAYTNDQMRITVGAPGVGVLTLGPSTPLKGQSSREALVANQAYLPETGTSFATPIVTGVVALMLQRNPGLTPAQVKQRLIETADPPTSSVPDPYLGYGIVNPLRALTGPAAPTNGHASATSSPAPIDQREPTKGDPRPARLALAAAGIAAVVAGGGLLVRLIVPSAARRKYAAAKR